jgi:lysophospholipase L1-like esterase
MGTNDIENGATPAMIASNAKLIVTELKKHEPEVPIVLCEVIPSSAKKNRPKETICKLNQLLAAVVKDDLQATLVDTWRLFANKEGEAKPEEFPDLLHPNKAGYAKWAASEWTVRRANRVRSSCVARPPWPSSCPYGARRRP